MQAGPFAGLRFTGQTSEGWAETGCREVAVLNGVAERVQVGGLFQGADFAAYAGRKTWLVMDIEGGEREWRMGPTPWLVMEPFFPKK